MSVTIPFRTMAASGSIRTNTFGVEYDASRALTGRSGRRKRILIMGIKLSTGTLAELTPRRVYSGPEADVLAGVGSQAAEMVRTAKKNNERTETWLCTVDELTGGTKGTKTITVTGTATADGTIHLYFDGLDFYVPVAIADGDDADAIAAKINTAVQAYRQYTRIPYVTTVATNVVTGTMKWKGVDVAPITCNYNDGDEFPAGVSVAIADGTAGAGNPDVTEILDVIANERFDHIVCPWIDATNMTALKDEMTRRWNGGVKLWGHSYISHNGIHGAAVTHGNAHNHPHLSTLPLNVSPSPVWKGAAGLAAVDASEEHPARPRQSMQIKGVYPPARDAVWIEDERNTLLFEGCSTYTVDGSRAMYIERITTTYKENAQGTEDWVFLDIERPHTLEAIFDDIVTRFPARYPRHLLALDGAEQPAGLPIITPLRAKGTLFEFHEDWIKAGWVQAAYRDLFQETAICDIAADNDSRLEADLGPALMRQFRGMNTKVSFL